MATEGVSPEKIKRGAIYMGAVLAAIVVGLYGVHFWKLRLERERLEEEAKLGPRVQVVSPTKSPPERMLNLVGEARPYASVTLYAKVSGYLKAVKVDKGDVVKKDQLLAIIESPEIDKEYQGALADARNKKAIAGRMNQLRERQLVSPQEADQANSDAEVANAKFEALAVQKGYETIRAPFPGTVTARFADAGALVQNAANSQTSALPLVTVSQVDRLRVYTYVDQRDAAYMKVGAAATVTVAERPDLSLAATVSRVSGELDPKTKMLLTEIDVDNKDQKLVPGSFVQVRLVVHTPEALQLPVQALVVQQGKTMLPIVGDDDLLHFREVRTGENDGQQVSVLSGLEPSARVALNVGNNLPEGSHVRPVAPEKKPEAAKPVAKVAEPPAKVAEPAAKAAEPAAKPDGESTK